jgi:hypothetical protein
MTEDFESALWKIDRAGKHADDLKAEISAFAETVPYRGEIVETSESGRAQYRVNHVAPLPVSFSLPQKLKGLGLELSCAGGA